MGMTYRERNEHMLRKKKAEIIYQIEQALTLYGRDLNEIAAILDLPVMHLDNTLRAWHIGPYDRRKEPRDRPTPSHG